MLAKHQVKRFGISVVPTQGGKVLFNIGDSAVAMPPQEARRFTYEVANAYFRAENMIRAEEREVLR